jgi:ribosome recycling factor
MDTHLKWLEKELLKIRTGRAVPSMIEDVKVASYGTSMPLRELAAISAPDASLLVVQPWDKVNIPEIEKALSSSDLGLSPANDGAIIRIQMPKMSSSRREELSKALAAKVEQAKVAIRRVRQDVHNLLRETEKAKKISEDYSRRLQEILQKATDRLIKSTDVIGEKKDKEIKAL